jgi:[ribosomal protein S5]-alanine N-acetyltransferase
MLYLEVTVKAPLEFETSRLRLIAPTAADADAILGRYAGDVEVTRYVGWPRHQSIADTRSFLAFSAAEWERWPAGPYLIRARSDGRLLGSTGLTFEGTDEAITGYVLARDAWGNGYATEALHAMVDLVRRLGLARICAFCHPDHRPSWRILEKCGFARDPDWSTQVEFPNLAPGLLQDVARYTLVLRPNAGHDE